jgi:uncharacterized protein (TIGR03437 family)
MRQFFGLWMVLFPIAFGQGQNLFGFLPNTGQFPAPVTFFHYAYDNYFYLTRDSFVLFNGVRIQLAGIGANVQPVGASPLPAIYNFYQGKNTAQWIANARLFGGVSLANAYPGVSATFATTTLGVGTLNVGQGEIMLAIAAGADPSPIQINVLNTGTNPFNGPGGVWYAGGSIPGTFIVQAQATQTVGGTATPVTCSLMIGPSNSLSIQLPNRNPALETDVAITFPDYDDLSRQLAPGFNVASTEYPVNFGQDGSIANSNCDYTCTQAVAADLDSNGNPLWVTVFGGSGGDDYASYVTASDNGAIVSGTTGSADFPVTASAPHASLLSSQDVFLAYFDAANGQLRNATFAGQPGPAGVGEQIAAPNGDIAIGGGVGTTYGTGGFIERWQPVQNRFAYELSFSDAVVSLAFDPSSNLDFVSFTSATAGSTMGVGELDSAGNLVGSVASIALPRGTQPSGSQLQPAGANGVWVIYSIGEINSATLPTVWAARTLPSSGQVAANVQVAAQGTTSNAELTPSGNLKLLVGGPAPTEATTQDAPLVAACPNTSYFAVLSPAGQMVYATYVPATGFNFASQNESAGPPPAAVSCIASTAGRSPGAYAAPGELITITGGGFGPSGPVYTAPGADGKYPLTAAGFNVQIGGLNAPVIAVARGLIAVQVPFEAPVSDELSQPLDVEVFQNGQQLGSTPMSVFDYVFNLFDTGDRHNSLNLPALAALNQDGTVNSVNNPAALGSVISVFGSGAGVLTPALETGGVNPIPPAGPLSLSPLYEACLYCSVAYFGSAPGASTGMVQVNLQLVASVPGTGVRPLGIGIAVGTSPRYLMILEPTGVVFVQ